jgi:hypothetical protein
MGSAQPEEDVMGSKKIQATKNYKLFRRHEGENRPLEVAKRASLKESMRAYGFLWFYPIIIYRDKEGNLIVKDGQHRLALAEELGLTVYWAESDQDFDVAVVNSAVKGWTNKDYALMFAAQGVPAYQECLEFSKRFRLAISNSATLLAGTTVFTNIRPSFWGGTFKVKDRAWAEKVAGLYAQVGTIGPAVKDLRFLLACMAVGRLDDFDAKRLIGGAERCREKLVKYGTRDGYLDMIEDLYNFGRSKRVAVKVPAINVMRERNPATKTKKDKKQDPPAEAA